jgi:protein phosphatase 2C-like protein
MRDRFELAAGSVGGRLHRDRGLNNQDAYRILEADDHLIAVVCDGCSSGGYSEVGARLGPDLVIPSIVQTLRDWGPGEERLASLSFWNIVRGTALRRLDRLIAALDGPLAETVERYFLFTVVGAVLTPEEACFFSVGDGVYAVNGEVIRLGPYPGEAPPYLAYGLFDGLADDRSAWQIGRCLPTDELDSFLLGSDGVTDLIEAATDEATYPGRPAKPIGPLEALWETDGYFENSDRLRRHLVLANRESSKPDWENQRVEKRQGLLPDDTTVIVGRQAKPQTEGG